MEFGSFVNIYTDHLESTERQLITLVLAETKQLFELYSKGGSEIQVDEYITFYEVLVHKEYCV